LRQIAVPFHPSETVEVHDAPTFVLVFVIWLEADLVIHADAVYLGSDVDEREVERVAVVGGHDGGTGLANMFKPSSNQSGLIVNFV
jgi:hypothetical protein